MNARAAVLAAAAAGALAVAGCGPTADSGSEGGPPSRAPTTSGSASATGPTGSGSAGAASTAPSASPSAAQPPATASVSAGAVRLQVTGGFVGKHDELTVDADGDWTYTGRSGTKHGSLTAAQRDRLTALATDPKLAAEAKLRMPKNLCADGQSFRLTVGSLTLMRADCGGSAKTPTFNAIVELLGKATPI